MVRPKAFDPSDPPTHGLLDEMSLAELQERLILVKSKEQREVEARRQRSIAMKEIKHRELMEKAADIAKIRQVARLEGQRRHEKLKQRQAEEDEVRRKFSEQCVVEAQEKISKKKQAM